MLKPSRRSHDCCVCAIRRGTLKDDQLYFMPWHTATWKDYWEQKRRELFILFQKVWGVIIYNSVPWHHVIMKIPHLIKIWPAMCQKQATFMSAKCERLLFTVMEISIHLAIILYFCISMLINSWMEIFQHFKLTKTSLILWAQNSFVIIATSTAKISDACWIIKWINNNALPIILKSDPLFNSVYRY